jgi:23S rRNA pseudouridine1911/1915/1917 synthase
MISGGVINKALGRDTKDRLKQAVIRNGREAITHYRVIDRFKSHTHVKAILETGRTHQIRVHLSHIGHALIGDSDYGGKLRYPKKASEDLKSALFNFRRQALHSRKLSLYHPETRELMSWRTSLPEDMLNLLTVIDRFDKIL